MTEQVITGQLRMAWSEAPWDQVVCGFPVLRITEMEALGPNGLVDFQCFERSRDRIGAGLVSCRLPHARMLEAMLLEDRGFRFVEMTYQPEYDLSKFSAVASPGRLDVVRALKGDLSLLLEIARTAFQNERFKVDPRLNPTISARRYQNWVASSLSHPSQELYVIRDGGKLLAFFVTELLGDGTCYWHLNAVAPELQGQGYGRRVWLSMLNHAINQDAKRVQTSIVARNHRVLNLYARLGFYFPPPSMTFHWVRQSNSSNTSELGS